MKQVCRSQINTMPLDDAWATVAVFSLLCKLDSEEKNEKIL